MELLSDHAIDLVLSSCKGILKSFPMLQDDLPVTLGPVSISGRVDALRLLVGQKVQDLWWVARSLSFHQGKVKGRHLADELEVKVLGEGHEVLTMQTHSDRSPRVSFKHH